MAWWSNPNSVFKNAIWEQNDEVIKYQFLENLPRIIKFFIYRWAVSNAYLCWNLLKDF